MQIFIAIVLSLTFANSNLFAQEPAGNYLSALELAVLNELNLARTSPSEYVDHLRVFRTYYQGKRLQRPGELIVVTQEGVSAVDEAIRYLMSVTPVAPLQPSRGLSESASEHANDQADSAMTGHVGSNGSQPWDRMNRYGTWQTAMAENISYGSNSAREIVMQQIIDDGVPERGHRHNLFNPDYRVIGIGCGSHAYYGSMCVMDFAAAFIEGSTD